MIIFLLYVTFFFFFPLFILKPCAVRRLDTFVPVNDNEVSFPG